MGPSNVLITKLIVQSLPSPKGCLYCGEPPDHTTVWSGYYWPVISNLSVLFLARTFEKLEQCWKNLFMSNIASWGPTGSKNTKISILGIFFVLWPKWLKISKIFDIFFDFCTNHERSIFAIKNSRFFSRKIAKIWRILTTFSDCYKKSARAKTAAD